MLEKVKLSLRIKSNKLDNDITELIEACKLDLGLSGIKKISDDDPLIVQAIKLYCKANFGIDSKNSDKFQQSYDLLKISLALCGDYNVG